MRYLTPRIILIALMVVFSDYALASFNQPGGITVRLIFWFIFFLLISFPFWLVNGYILRRIYTPHKRREKNFWAVVIGLITLQIIGVLIALLLSQLEGYYILMIFLGLLVWVVEPLGKRS